MRENLIGENMKHEIDLDFIDTLKFDEKGLIPAVVQDVDTKEVLMLAYMNKESMKKTLIEKRACYFSRSREKLWTKGETSGNTQEVVEFYFDCDKDTILLLVKQKGVKLGAGEIVVNSIDEDGMKNGYDIELLSKITQAVSVPVIASGGAGTMEDFCKAAKEANCDGILAASVFHFGEIKIKDLKEYMKKEGIEVRL